jgi:hypothetical protein
MQPLLNQPGSCCHSSSWAVQAAVSHICAKKPSLIPCVLPTKLGMPCSPDLPTHPHPTPPYHLQELARKRRKIPESEYKDGPDGLRYYDLTVGAGAEPKLGDRVAVHFGEMTARAAGSCLWLCLCYRVMTGGLLESDRGCIEVCLSTQRPLAGSSSPTA